jgi:rhodanese-related sulfurtransferase
MPRTYTIIILSIVILIIVLLYKNYNILSTEISPNIAKRNVDLGLYDYVVDVRTKEEWDEGHIPYTISIPIGNFVKEFPEKIPDKNAKILFICKKGIRAGGVITIANKLGYNNVHAMIGNYKDLQ